MAGQRHGKHEAAHAKAGGNAQRRGRDARAHVGLVEVGAHAGHVAHVVAHVVGDNGGVAGVILRDAGFHLAHEVGAHVGSLGEDTAANTGKQSHEGGAHAKGQHQRGNLGNAFCLRQGAEPILQEIIPERNVQQAQADNHKAHDRAGRESQAQAVVEALFGRPGGSGVGRRCNLHAEKSGQTGKEAAGQEGNGNKDVHKAGH